MAYSMLPIGYHTSETSKENLQRHEISRIPVSGKWRGIAV